MRTYSPAPKACAALTRSVSEYSNIEVSTLSGAGAAAPGGRQFPRAGQSPSTTPISTSNTPAESPRGIPLPTIRAMDDAANRWSAHYGADIARLPRWQDVKPWAERFRCETMLLMAPFVGPDADSWRPVRQFLCDKGINVIECRRAWDRRLFPAARSGFFPFWHKVRPGLLKQGS